MVKHTMYLSKWILLKVTHIIPEGKGKMTAGDFIRGRKLALGDILE